MNVINNGHPGMHCRTGRVTHRKRASIDVRWATAAFLEAATDYWKITGYGTSGCIRKT